MIRHMYIMTLLRSIDIFELVYILLFSRVKLAKWRASFVYSNELFKLPLELAKKIFSMESKSNGSISGLWAKAYGTCIYCKPSKNDYILGQNRVNSTGISIGKKRDCLFHSETLLRTESK